MIRSILCFLVVVCLGGTAKSQEKFGPEDPIASIDGAPVFLGELNLVLVDRLRIKDLSKAKPDVQQATAALLVRQHLALKTLFAQGGETLQAMVDRQISDFANDSKRRGSSLQKHAQQRSSDERSLKASLTWQIAWGQYLKSRLTDANLRKYFERNRQKYAGGRWEVSQVFLEIDPKDKTTLEIAKQRMDELVDQLSKSSEPEVAFAAAAREHSDAGSAATGGQVGWVEKDGDLPSSVMKAVRATKVGDISPPVRSPLGLHTVFVHDFKASDLAFEDLTDQSQLRRDATDALFDQLVRQQKDAKIAWYISGLKPPAGVSLIPK